MEGEKANGKTMVAIVVLLLLVVLSFACACIQSASGETSPVYAEINSNGKISKVDLDENQVIAVKNEYGFNEISIEDSKVKILNADCKTHDCIRQGTISKSGETIICLPHKLSIRIVALDDSGSSSQQDGMDFEAISR